MDEFDPGSAETIAERFFAADLEADRLGEGPAIGREFGPYTIEREIGRGGMGVVFAARHRDLDRSVALKMILSSHLAGDGEIARFQDEARALARLGHPNVVAIHDVGCVLGQHYFAMEYVDGPSLADRIESGRIPLEEGVRIVADVARAVEHFHARGILHRDLKPANILLDAGGRPRVTDFGLVKVLGDEGGRTQTGLAMGTPSYMAPEQASGDAESIGPGADVHGLGAILFEILAGRPPFREETCILTLLSVLEKEAPRLRDIDRRLPPTLDRICRRCLEKDPADRYPSAGALADDLERVLRGEPIETRPEGVVGRAVRWSHREPALAARLAVAAVWLPVEWANHFVWQVSTRAVHVQVVASLLVWIAIACGVLAVRRRVGTGLAQLLWLAGDMIFATGVLFAAEGVASPLVVGYLLLIVGSGLAVDPRQVWLALALAAVGYSVHVADSQLRRTDLILAAHFHIVAYVSMAVAAGLTAFQVRRLRRLSRFLDRRTPA